MAKTITEVFGSIFNGDPKADPDIPDLDVAFVAVREEIKDATLDISKVMSEAGIEYALIGGLAAGSYSIDPMTTTDVDFIVSSRYRHLVDRSAWALKMQLPPSASKVRVHVMSPKKGDEIHIDRSIRASKESCNVRVIPVEALFFLKLDRMLSKDVAHLVEVIKSGANIGRIISYIRQHGRPGMMEKLVRVIDQAKLEKEQELAGVDWGYE